MQDSVKDSTDFEPIYNIRWFGNDTAHNSRRPMTKHNSSDATTPRVIVYLEITGSLWARPQHFYGKNSVRRSLRVCGLVEEGGSTESRGAKC